MPSTTAAGAREAGDCVSDEVGEVAFRMNGRISRWGEQFGVVESNLRVGLAVTTLAESAEELRSAGPLGGGPSRSCSVGARGLVGRPVFGFLVHCFSQDPILCRWKSGQIELYWSELRR